MLRFYKSFLYALNGVIVLTKTERNFQIIVVGAILSLITSIGFEFSNMPLNSTEWLFIFFGIGLVSVSEALNTAIEKTLDTLHPNIHPGVGKAKDMAAGATMIASTIALIIGIIVFGPRFWELLPL